MQNSKRRNVPRGDHRIVKALKEKGLNSPEMVAEVGRRLEAGETVTAESLAQDLH
jgi:hypothetical protein